MSAMKSSILCAAVLVGQAAGEFLCQRMGACAADEEGSLLLHTRIHKANVSKHFSQKMMNFERPPKGYSFEEYMKDFGKTYDASELQQRKEAFEKSLKEVEEHNSKPEMSWKLAINEYSDWSEKELKSLRGLKKHKREASAFKTETLHIAREEVYPDNVDWRESGKVTPPKNQGHCGSCWAFATTGAVESAAAINSGLLTVLAPQQLVSCAENLEHCGGTGGCDGSTSELAMEYIKDHGMVGVDVIPYESFFGADVECSASMKQHAQWHKLVTITGWVKTTTNNLDAVMHAIVNKGPLAISVDASHWSGYSSGIANPCDMNGNIDIDHAVGLVGYGVDNGKKYWLVRNSWGATWGEHGYIRPLLDSA